jgi:pseudouridine-5'-phosphate glycosidase
MSEHLPQINDGSVDFRFSDEVREAQAAGRAVVALESTVIAHGLPQPQNLKTGRRLEEVVRQEGATPATIAIIKGVVCLGLQADELHHLAFETKRVRKVSIRDLPVVMARKLDGATTVAATIYLAHRAGCKVFATGGIGGVHRDAPWDVSADLPALASTPLTVVCSGAKSVLDLPATREWLETYGVTVAGYQCDELPAFYSRSSDLMVDVRVDSAAEVAQLARARDALKLSSALLVANPVPAEAELPAEELQRTLDEALRQAAQSNITGRALTPFLLSRMATQSGGATIKTNVALLENNARLAAQISLILAD